jgi:hypothetical protein
LINISVKIQVRRDSSANWTSNNPTLAEGEIGYETDTGKLKIGSGASWTSTQYFPSSLEFIGDVDIMTPSDNDVLTWDSATSKWSSQTSAGGVATIAGDLDGNLSGASYTYGLKDIDFVSSQAISSNTINSNTVTNYYNVVTSGLRFDDANVELWRWGNSLQINSTNDITLNPTDNVIIGNYTGKQVETDYYAIFDGDAGRFWIGEGGGGSKLPSYTMHVSGNIWGKTISSQSLIRAGTGIYTNWISGSNSNLAGHWTQTGDDIYYASGEVRIGHSSFDCGNQKFQVSGDTFLSGNVTFIGELSGLADPTYASGASNKHYVDYRTPTTTEPSKVAGAIWASGNSTYTGFYHCTSNNGSWKLVSYA